VHSGQQWAVALWKAGFITGNGSSSWILRDMLQWIESKKELSVSDSLARCEKQPVFCCGPLQVTSMEIAIWLGCFLCSLRADLLGSKERAAESDMKQGLQGEVLQTIYAGRVSTKNSSKNIIQVNRTMETRAGMGMNGLMESFCHYNVVCQWFQVIMDSGVFFLLLLRLFYLSRYWACQNK
jgi:hypothetical protein